VLPRIPRRTTTGVIASAAALAVAGIWLGIGPASAGSLAGTLYRDPSSNVVRWVAANSGDSRAAVIRANVASQPQARWFSSFNPSTVQSEASSFVGAANAAGQVPVLSVYEITNRDCGGASAGGAPDLNQYQTWITNFAHGLGSQPVVIILETDSIALQTCLNSSTLAARNTALTTAVQTIKANNASAKVYLDGGHSAWNSAADQASRLRAAGIQFADGFFTNVSNFNSTGNEANYGRSVISALNGAGVSGKHQVIDTSRNGGAAGDWCADDNSDRRIGQYPTLNTGDANIDGYLWVKPPGEADGCAFSAGSFQPQLAFSLANGVAPPPNTVPPSSNPPSSQPPSSRPPSSNPPSSRPPSSNPPSSRPPSSNPPSSGPVGTPGGCTATYTSTNQWTPGFGASVTVKAGNAPINGWTVRWTFANGQTITQLWDGNDTASGAAHSVTNMPYNGSLAASGTATFGFNGTWSGTNSIPTLTCTSP
jgi:endoglucanase